MFKYKHKNEENFKMCKNWYDSFDVFYFWLIENGFEKEKFICRINRKEMLCPINIQLIDKKYFYSKRGVQKKYNAHGKALTLMEWSNELNIKYTSLKNRLRSGYPPEIAFDSNFRTRKNWNKLFASLNKGEML